MNKYRAIFSNGRVITFPANCQRHANNYASRVAGKECLKIKTVKQV